MDAFQPPFLHHVLQEPLESGTKSDFDTDGNNGADQRVIEDMNFEHAGGVTGQPHQLYQFGIPIDDGNRYGPLGFEQYSEACGAPQRSSPRQHAWPDQESHAPGTASMLHATHSSVISQSLGSNHISYTTFPSYDSATTQNTPLGVDFTSMRFLDQLYSQDIDFGQNGPEIGVVFENGKFACVHDTCMGRTFSRRAELRRHYRTLHDPDRESFWCNVTTCNRNKNKGDKPFHRSDKLEAHIRQVHGHE